MKSSIPFEIRPLVASDLPRLRAVIDSTGLFPSEMLDEMVAEHLSGSTGENWLTLDANGPAAIVYYAPERMTQGTWNLLLIAVHADHHGEGLGTAIMDHVERVLAAQGERVLLVETSGLPEFERTRNFYRCLGYDEEARIREFYAAGEDKIVFRKALVATD